MVKNEELTTTQRAALRAYQKFSKRYGASPSVRQFAQVLGVSHQGAHYLIATLREKGFLAPRATAVLRLGVSAKGKKAL